MRLNILFYIDSLLPAGGQEKVVSSHLNMLAENGNDCFLLTKDDGVSFYELNNSIKKRSINISSYQKYDSRFFRFFYILFSLFNIGFKINSFNKSIMPDLVYCSSPLNVIEVLLSGFPVNKIVVSEHSSFSSHNIVYQLIISFIYKYVKVFLVPTTYDSDIYSKKNIKNFYLPNPILIPKNIKNTSNKEKIVLSIGRLCTDKRHDLLLEIWKNSSARNNGWRLLIVGEGELHDYLEEHITSFGLIDTVSLLPNTNNIEYYYNKASIYVHTSRCEGFGLVLAEAGSFGIPVVCFDVPSGPKDIVKNGHNGYLVEDNNIDDFMDILNCLTNDSNNIECLSNNAIHYSNKFDYNRIHNNLISIIKGEVY